MPSDPVWRLVPEATMARLGGCAEPAARWVWLTTLRGRSPDDPDVAEAHQAVLADPRTEDLLRRLKPWDVENPISGHHRPEFAPNLLGLLADMGVGAADDPRVADCLAGMLEHQAPDGRFLALGRGRGQALPTWAALPCDAHAILETLARAGHADDPRVRRAFARLAADLTGAPQGPGWTCLPDPAAPFRGPGRKGDICPQVTLEALRAISFLPGHLRPDGALDAARSVLGVWRGRGASQPYMFGHGRRFKRVKWPPTWYSSLAVVDAVGRYPQVWHGPDADPADRAAMAEVVACLIAYNLGVDGGVTPRSIIRGYERQSFGQKKAPSDFATALVAAALTRVDLLADDVRSVDVLALSSSKGGSGSPLPP